jgi:hypothetical protein
MKPWKKKRFKERVAPVLVKRNTIRRRQDFLRNPTEERRNSKITIRQALDPWPDKEIEELPGQRNLWCMLRDRQSVVSPERLCGHA